ncbi:probable cadmium/zinc-transporting ATPase HMA1, chloroplastic [Vigna radiata var. radiata]|uniref:Probable cadmium/zinc-transporting ATPase HMA1, chloroplastic n=1 Tax=Vigna radiata var. radiata TaxID=3916 RepID=A0A3Q0F7Y3_VIGRR|nr:probable cadmium/zinc-transporting ATPase HMA1, chloroplastic [Vigna radiata var. radiata]
MMQVTLIHLEDRPHPGAFNVIQELQDEAEFRVIMLTGDHESSVKRVASAVGIKVFHCNLKPEDKLSHVKDTSRDMEQRNGIQWKRMRVLAAEVVNIGGCLGMGELLQ